MSQIQIDPQELVLEKLGICYIHIQEGNRKPFLLHN